MSYNDGPELIGLGRVGRVMRFGDIAVKTANVWTVPKGASETTIISYEQTNKLNKQSLKHEGHVYSHLGHVPGDKALSHLRHRVECHTYARVH